MKVSSRAIEPSVHLGFCSHTGDQGELNCLSLLGRPMSQHWAWQMSTWNHSEKGCDADRQKTTLLERPSSFPLETKEHPETFRATRGAIIWKHGSMD